MAGRMPPARRGRPYYDADRGQRMIVPREGGKAIPYVGPRPGFDARRALRRSGVAGRDLAGDLLATTGRGATAVADRSGFNGGALIGLVVSAAAGLLGLILIDLLLSDRGSRATSGLLGAASGGIRRLLDPYDTVFGDRARAADQEARANRSGDASPASTREPSRSSTGATVPAGPTVTVAGRVFPLAPTGAQRRRVYFSDDFGSPRSSGGMNTDGRHGAIDIFAPLGTPVVASEDGVLSQVGWQTLGGNRLHVVNDAGDGYYAHLDRYAPGVRDGVKVRAGDLLGYVGMTGQAGGVAHLHYAYQPSGASSYANPYPLLKQLWDALTGPTNATAQASKGVFV